MILTTTDEARALAAAADRFLGERWDLARVRAALDRKGPGAEDTARAYDEMGWTALIVDAEFGGGGGDLATASVLLERIGRHLAPNDVASGLLSAAVLSALPEGVRRKNLITRHCDGEIIAVVATDEHGRAGSPLALLHDTDDTVSVDIDTVWAPLTARTTHILVPVAQDSGWVLVPVDVEGLTITPLRRLDALPLSAVSGTGISVRSEYVLEHNGPNLDFVQALGALFTAADLVGVTAVLLERTCEYATTRQQFGRPIGSFQAVSHRLADTLVDLEIGRSLVAGAAHAYDGGAADRLALMSAAKAWMSDAAVRAGETAVQLHGGIGFTWESDVHLYLRRARAQAASFGTARHHRALLAAGLGAWAKTEE